MASRQPRFLTVAAVLLGSMIVAVLPSSAAAAATGRIAGTVTSTRSVEGVSVEFYTYNEDFGWEPNEYAEVDSGGSYSADLAPGSYRVCARGADFVPSCFGQTGDDDDTSTTVTVTSDATSTVDLTLQPLGEIAGTVRDLAGQPVSGVTVTFYEHSEDEGDGGDGGVGESEWWPNQTTETDDLGHYRMPLDAGQYKVGFDASGLEDTRSWQPEFYDDAHRVELADVVSVTNGAVSTADGRFDLGATISGTVTGPDGGDEDVTVSAYQLVDDEWVARASAGTGEDGSYQLEGLLSGTYRVCVDHYQLAWKPTCLGGSSPESATDVTVTAPQVSTGKDLTMSRNGWVTGAVVDPGGEPVEGITVVASDTDEERGASRTATTDSDGRYRMYAEPGSYTLEFSDPDQNWVTEYYDNASDVDSATPLAIADGVETPADDVVLAPAGSIAGKITTAAANTSEWDFDVSATNVSTHETYTPKTELIKANYVIKGLPAGTYRVDLGRSNGGRAGYPYAGEYFDNVHEGKSVSPTLVTVATGQHRTGVNAVLETGGTITGKVLWPDGTPVRGCPVDVWEGDDFFARYTYTAADGSFTVRGLSTGGYLLVVGHTSADDAECGAGAQYYDGDAVLSPQESTAHVSASLGKSKAVGTLTYGEETTQLTNREAPGLDRGARVGAPITVSTGTWTPAPSSFTYSWRADGVPIAGAHAARFTPTTAELGKAISAVVTAHRSGYSDVSAVSDESGPTKQGLLVAGSPTVSGKPTVGSVLTAATGTWAPTGATLSFQWLAGGTPVGSNANTFTPDAGQIGKRISVTVTGHKEGYTAATATSVPTAAIGDPTAVPVNTTRPSITGTRKVGHRVTANAGAWTPGVVHGVTFGYVWKLGSRTIGTTKSLTLPATAARKKVTLTVTATSQNATPGVATSAAATIASGTFSFARNPRITGTAAVTRVLTFSTERSTPAPTSRRFQWLRAGRAISGATRSTYRLVPADRNRRISLRVTYARTGYVSTARTTAATAAVR